MYRGTLCTENGDVKERSKTEMNGQKKDLEQTPISDLGCILYE